LKFYGYPGVLLLVAAIIAFYWYVSRCGVSGQRGYVGRFAAAHFTCILISLVTQIYLTKPEGIVVVCLVWALVVKAAQTPHAGGESVMRPKESQTEFRAVRTNQLPGRGGEQSST
jgi:hypothetical protein